MHAIIPLFVYQKRSTRSAEPAFGSKRNLSILCNRYAEDVITDEAQIVRAPQHVRVRQLRSPERFVSKKMFYYSYKFLAYYSTTITNIEEITNMLHILFI